MRKKFAVIMLSAALGSAILNGCGKTDKGQDKKLTSAWEEEDAVYGEVSKVTEDTVTIKVGTRKDMEQPQKGDLEKTEEDQNGEKLSMLDLTGEEQELAVTEDTIIKRQNMRSLPENGEKPQKLDGEEGEKPQKPDEENGEMPQRPDEEDGEKPQKPDGEPPQEPGTGQEDSSEEIAVSDISEGDIIMVTFTDEKKAAEITVLSVPGGNGGDTNPPAGGQDRKTGTV